MDIFKYAMKMEKDGEAYYRELANKCGDQGLKNILNMLADDEVKHFNVLNEMRKGEKSKHEATEILSDSKNIFNLMKEKNETLSLDISQKEIYKRAQETEKQSEEFYRQKSEEATDPHLKETLLKFAEDEKKHYVLLDNIIELISRPDYYLENAEFCHLDEY